MGVCHLARTWGLSPRVRGSHLSIVCRAIALGSIPAGAGEPRARGAMFQPTRVYPRGCGGAGLTGFVAGAQ